MNAWIATDIDHTLCARAWQGPTAVPATWHPPEAQGQASIASSWMREETHRVMLALSRIASLVPVTARDAESFARLDIPGLPMRGPAVIANGAILLDRQGLPDAAWEAEMAGRLAPVQKHLESLLQNLEKKGGRDVRARLVTGPQGLSAYLVAKAPSGWWNSEAARLMLTTMEWHACTASIQQDELQVLPPGMGKVAGATALRDRWFGGQPPLLCLGDTPGDLEFMRLGGLLVTPKGSALEEAWP